MEHPSFIGNIYTYGCINHLHSVQPVPTQSAPQRNPHSFALGSHVGFRFLIVCLTPTALQPQKFVRYLAYCIPFIKQAQEEKRPKETKTLESGEVPLPQKTAHHGRSLAVSHFPHPHSHPLSHQQALHQKRKANELTKKHPSLAAAWVTANNQQPHKPER